MPPATAAEIETIGEVRRKHGGGFIARQIGLRAINYAVLSIVAVISSIPLLWMLTTSLKEHLKEFRFPPELIPDPFQWNNYIDVWPETGMHIFFLNSVFFTVAATVGTVLTASMVAFGFARIEFPGRNILFVLMLSTMMLPEIVTLVPSFVLFRILGWIDTPMPLIVPFWFGGGAFYIFLIRQFMLQLPRELEEAAFADGASHFRIYWNIVLPLSGPALATVAIFSVVSRWNDFLAPLIFLNSEKWRPLALALRNFLVAEQGGGIAGAVPRWNLLMASSIVMLIPIMLLFFSAQKYFVRGIALTGITGR